MVRWEKIRRRFSVRLARARQGLLRVWDDRPGLRIGAAVLLALVVNAGLLHVFGRLPLRLPPMGEPPGVPIEIVFLEAEVVPAPTPELEIEPEEIIAAEEIAPEPEPETDEEPPRPEEIDADLPKSQGTSGVVALDCNRVFDEEGRVVACAGGRITLDYDVDRKAWEDISAALPENYGPAEPDAPSGRAPLDGGLAGDPRTLGSDRNAARFARTDERNAPQDSVLSAGGAEDAAATGSDILAVPSIVTSYGDRKIAEDREEARQDAILRRKLEKEE